MRINSIQAYNYNSNDKNLNCQKKQSPSFGMKIPMETENKLLISAVDYGTKILELTKKQLANVKLWGRKDTNLTESFDLRKGITNFGLDIPSVSKSYGASLPERKTLLGSFLSWTENDIKDAEKSLLDIVDNNKKDLLGKAQMNKKLEAKILGKNIDDSAITEKTLIDAIEKLPEERVTELRFGLDEPSKYAKTNSDIIQFDFS